MNLDDAKELWSSENDPDTPAMSASTLSDTEILRLVKDKAEALDRRLWRRDLLESIAAVAVILFFGWTLLDAASWWTRAGALLVMGGSAYVFWRLRRARTRYDDPDPDRPVAEVIRTQRDKVEEQIQLLDNLLWWYLAPIVLGALLIVVGGNGWSWATLLQGGAVLAVAAIIYALNQRGRRCTFEPRRKELTRLLEQVQEDDRS